MKNANIGINMIFALSKNEAVDAVVYSTARNKKTGIKAEGMEIIKYCFHLFLKDVIIS